MRRTYPLSNDKYASQYTTHVGEYPTWWEENGGRLIPLETGIGARIWYCDWKELNRRDAPSCAFDKGAPVAFYPQNYTWRFWVYGPFSAVYRKGCTHMEINEWVFSIMAPTQPPTPLIRAPRVIASDPVQPEDIKEDRVAAYVTRATTQKMELGLYYLGILAPETSLGESDTSPDSIEWDKSPLERVQHSIQLPPLWMYLGDSQRNFHSRHEDIPLKKRSPCP